MKKIAEMSIEEIAAFVCETLRGAGVTVTELPTTVSDPPPVIGPPDPPVIAVPEPSTWAMLLLGFLGLGYAGYRKASRDRRVFPRA